MFLPTNIFSEKELCNKILNKPDMYTAKSCKTYLYTLYIVPALLSLLIITLLDFVTKFIIIILKLIKAAFY